MVWIVRILKIGQMARHARRVRQTIVGIDVALAALQRSVRARKWPPRSRMVERSCRPCGCVVTNLALLRETC